MSYQTIYNPATGQTQVVDLSQSDAQQKIMALYQQGWTSATAQQTQYAQQQAPQMYRPPKTVTQTIATTPTKTTSALSKYIVDGQIDLVQVAQAKDQAALSEANKLFGVDKVSFAIDAAKKPVTEEEYTKLGERTRQEVRVVRPVSKEEYKKLSDRDKLHFYPEAEGVSAAVYAGLGAGIKERGLFYPQLKWYEHLTSVKEEEGEQVTAKSFTLQVGDAVVPFMYAARNWNEMQDWEKGVHLFADIVFTATMLTGAKPIAKNLKLRLTQPTTKPITSLKEYTASGQVKVMTPTTQAKMEYQALQNAAKEANIARADLRLKIQAIINAENAGIMPKNMALPANRVQQALMNNLENAGTRALKADTQFAKAFTGTHSMSPAQLKQVEKLSGVQGLRDSVKEINAIEAQLKKQWGVYESLQRRWQPPQVVYFRGLSGKGLKQLKEIEFYTTDKSYAKKFANLGEGKGEIKSVALNPQKPLIVEDPIEALRKLGLSKEEISKAISEKGGFGLPEFDDWLGRLAKSQGYDSIFIKWDTVKGATGARILDTAKGEVWVGVLNDSIIHPASKIASSKIAMKVTRIMKPSPEAQAGGTFYLNLQLRDISKTHSLLEKAYSNYANVIKPARIHGTPSRMTEGFGSAIKRGWGKLKGTDVYVDVSNEKMVKQQLYELKKIARQGKLPPGEQEELYKEIATIEKRVSEYIEVVGERGWGKFKKDDMEEFFTDLGKAEAPSDQPLGDQLKMKLDEVIGKEKGKPEERFWEKPAAVATKEKAKVEQNLEKLYKVKEKAAAKEVEPAEKVKAPKIEEQPKFGMKPKEKVKLSAREIPQEARGRMTFAQIAREYGEQAVEDAIGVPIGSLNTAGQVKTAIQINQEFETKLAGATNAATQALINTYTRTHNMNQAEINAQNALENFLKTQPAAQTQLETKTQLAVDVAVKEAVRDIMKYKVIPKFTPGTQDDKLAIERVEGIPRNPGIVSWNKGISGIEITPPYREGSEDVHFTKLKKPQTGKGSQERTLRVRGGRAPKLIVLSRYGGIARTDIIKGKRMRHYSQPVSQRGPGVMDATGRVRRQRRGSIIF